RRRRAEGGGRARHLSHGGSGAPGNVHLIDAQNEAALAQDAERQAFIARVRGALSGDVFLVGGFLRDILTGRPAVDLDLALAGSPVEAANSLAVALGGSPFPLDSDRGQYRVVLAPGEPLHYIDLAPLRGSIEN